MLDRPKEQGDTSKAMNAATEGLSKEQAMEYALEIALDFDVSSPEGRAVFFSSGQKKAATDYCRKEGDGHINVCMTPALMAFDQMNLFRRGDFAVEEIFALGDMISERFAMEASGNVTAFVGEKSKPTGTFRRVELPALMANPDVKTINEQPKHEYLGMVLEQNRERVIAALKEQTPAIEI